MDSLIIPDSTTYWVIVMHIIESITDGQMGSLVDFMHG